MTFKKKKKKNEKGKESDGAVVKENPPVLRGPTCVIFDWSGRYNRLSKILGQWWNSKSNQIDVEQAHRPAMHIYMYGV